MKSCDSKGMLQECSGDSSQTFKRVWKKNVPPTHFVARRCDQRNYSTRRDLFGPCGPDSPFAHSVRAETCQRLRIKIAGHDAGELD